MSQQHDIQEVRSRGTYDISSIKRPLFVTEPLNLSHDLLALVWDEIVNIILFRELFPFGNGKARIPDTQDLSARGDGDGHCEC